MPDFSVCNPLALACSELRDRLVTGSLEMDCALVNAALVADAIVLRAAAEKALRVQQRGTLRCKTAHAELVFNLSGSKHVSWCWASHSGCRECLPALP